MSNTTDYPSNYDKVIATKELPVASIDNESFITFINSAFSEAYGYESEQLIGRSVTNIMPEHLRNMHMIGFSRFLATETPRLLGKPVPVKILCQNSEVKDVELFILGRKKDNKWEFAAIIKPV